LDTSQINIHPPKLNPDGWNNLNKESNMNTLFSELMSIGNWFIHISSNSLSTA
jgi:hypothetical protein